MKTFSEICAEEGTDKAPQGHAYSFFYESILKPKREYIRNLLEIGVMEGSSHRAWEKWLPNAEIYEGELAHNKRNGQGLWTGETGHQYNGQWLKNMKHGAGKFSSPSGEVYDGEWIKFFQNLMIFLKILPLLVHLLVMTNKFYKYERFNFF